jgi:acyl transferase domain-containing protein
MRAFSPDGRCYVFDRRANGFVPGEGCGVVVLKLLDKAIEDGDRIYAVIDGSAVNNDGNTMGITTPNPEAQMQVIQEALDAGGIDPSTISYIEAHGTGTMIGDPIELKALTAVFRKSTQDRQFCGVGSVKTNIGHLLLASGIAGFIKVVMCISNRQIPASLNCEEPNPRFEFDKSPFYINRALKDWTPREGVWRAGISSFGLGGTNGHILVSNLDGQQFKDYKCRRNPLPPVMFNRKRLWADKKETGDCTYRQPENTDVKPGMLRLEKKR